MNFKLSNYVVISDPIGPAHELTAKRLLFSTRKGMGITVTNYLLSLLQAGQFESIPDHMFNILMYHEIIVPADENEFDEIVQRKISSALDARLSEVTITIDQDTHWNNGIIDRINNRIAASLSSAESKTQNFQLHLDINAPTFAAMASLYDRANGFLKNRKFPVRVKSDCTLQCLYTIGDKIQPIHEDAIGITSLKLSVDLSHQSLTQGSVQDLNSLFLQLHENDIKTSVTLLLNTSALQLLQGVRDMLDSFMRSRKNSVEIRLTDKSEDTEEEKTLITHLSQLNLHLDFFPAIDSMYFGETGSLRTPREYYDEPIVNALTQGSSRCASCIYLPMCGGKLHKHPHRDDDCPAFVQNFMDKARLKYGQVI